MARCLLHRPAPGSPQFHTTTATAQCTPRTPMISSLSLGLPLLKKTYANVAPTDFPHETHSAKSWNFVCRPWESHNSRTHTGSYCRSFRHMLRRYRPVAVSSRLSPFREFPLSFVWGNYIITWKKIQSFANQYKKTKILAAHFTIYLLASRKVTAHWFVSLPHHFPDFSLELLSFSSATLHFTIHPERGSIRQRRHLPSICT